MTLPSVKNVTLTPVTTEIEDIADISKALKDCHSKLVMLTDHFSLTEGSGDLDFNDHVIRRPKTPVNSRAGSSIRIPDSTFV